MFLTGEINICDIYDTILNVQDMHFFSGLTQLICNNSSINFTLECKVLPNLVSRETVQFITFVDFEVSDEGLKR